VRVVDLLKSVGLVTTGDETPTFKPEEVQATVEAKTHDGPVESMPAASNELTIDFAEIFQSLKIAAPPHGWNVDRMLTALNTPEFKTLDAATTKAALVAMLAANAVPAKDIIADAVNRDKALDAYEAFAHQKLEERAAARRTESNLLEQQIKDCQQKIAAIIAASVQDKNAFESWVKKKTEKEEELVRVVSMLTDKHGITVGKK
jgi:hypothetical protein